MQKGIKLPLTDIEAAKTLDIFFNPTKANPNWAAIDKMDEYISSLPNRIYGDLYEEGTPGLYTRQITLPAKTLLTSKIHKTCHPFIVTKGAITVYNAVGDTQEMFTTGYRGITLPGTRRVLYTHDETIWITFHPTNKIGYDFLNLQKAEQQSIFDNIMAEDILQEYYNPLLNDFEEGIFI